MSLLAQEEISYQEMQEIFKYSRVIQSSTQKLGKVAGDTDFSITQKRLFANQIRKDASDEMRHLAAELRDLSDSVKEMQKAMTMIVSRMKSSVKKDEFSRLEKRIDAWGPHRLVSRREAQRVLKYQFI